MSNSAAPYSVSHADELSTQDEVRIDLSFSADRWKLLGAIALLIFSLVAFLLFASALFDWTGSESGRLGTILGAPILSACLLMAALKAYRQSMMSDELIFKGSEVVHVRRALPWKRVSHYLFEDIDFVSWQSETVKEDQGTWKRGFLSLSHRGKIIRLLDDPSPSDVRRLSGLFESMGIPQK